MKAVIWASDGKDTYPKNYERSYSELLELFQTSKAPSTHKVTKNDTAESIAEKEAKAKAEAEKKAKKIARDKAQREANAKARAEHEAAKGGA